MHVDIKLYYMLDAKSLSFLKWKKSLYAVYFWIANSVYNNLIVLIKYEKAISYHPNFILFTFM